jgi:hypothetical protein
MSFPSKVKILFEKLFEEKRNQSVIANNLCDIQYCRTHGLQTEFPVLRLKGMSEFDDSGKNRRDYPIKNFNEIKVEQ